MQSGNCDRCYRRKSRCDRSQPCGLCVKSGVRCVYTDRSREKSIRPEVLERLEKRLSHSQEQNKHLTAELARLKLERDSDRESGVSSASRDTVATEKGDRSDDLATHMSILSTGAAGERQFLGSTSGVLFADLVRASVDIPCTGRASSLPTVHSNELPTSLEDAHAESPRHLAPRNIARALVQAYLDHDHLCYPFLIPSEICQSLDRLYDVGHREMTPYELFVLDMIFAISTAHVSKLDQRQLPYAEDHHSRAMSGIYSVLRSGGLKALHAILLLCQFRTGSSIRDNSGSMWLLVGVAARMCFEMGLHKDSTYPLTGPGDDEASARSYALQESKRWSIWSTLCLDRITSLILGRPYAIRDEDFDHICKTEDEVVSMPTPHGDQQTKPFVFKHIVAYRVLCGRIITAMHRRRSADITEQYILRQRQNFCKDLVQWRQDVEALGLVQDAEAASSCYLSLEWFDLLYANAMLLLWRPTPSFPEISHDATSLQNIFDSAARSITIYASLHRSRKINYSWITLQSLFLAGLSYVYACGRHFRAQWRDTPRHSLRKDPTAMEIVNITRSCSNVLVAVSERWNALRHCHQAFDRLSDAVLSDAIKIQTARAQASAQSLTSDIAPLDRSLFSASGAGPMASHLAVDSEFLHCFDDLQHLYDTQHMEDPIMELSEDWLGQLGDDVSLPNTSYQVSMF